jgi:ribonucleoside-triphosphate reductase (thioredoxin)
MEIEKFCSDILTKDFLKKYTTKKVPWGFGDLSYIVYKRTYSRAKENGEQEEWWETIARAINGAQKIGAKYSKAEAEKLYDHMFNLRCFFSGRGLWQLGTKTVDLVGHDSLLNCWVTKVSTVDDFHFIFTESMLGGGVGCNISREYTQELPRVKRNVRCVMKNTKDAEFIVPDSKEGWGYLWRKILKSYLITGESFSYSNVCIRPAGEPLKTFGGIAPGPKPLMDGCQELCRILESREGKKLRTQDVADIICCGGQVVKSGGIRRTALILLGDVDDIAFLNLKRWDLDITIPAYRSNSNNSSICNDYSHLLENYWKPYDGSGECYGLLNLKNSKRFGRLNETKIDGFDLFDDDIIGGNPCAEALLADKEPCNLAELALNNIKSKEEMLECAILLYKSQKAIAAGHYLFDETNEIVHKKMRLGLGVTGVCQNPNYPDWCDYVYKELRKFDKKYSKENNFPQSARLTVVKPSGTLSLLSGSSPGANPGYSQYHFRTVRFSSMDKLVPMLKEAGYHIEPEKRLDRSLNHDIAVIYFPCKFSEDTLCEDKSDVIDQLERIKSLQICWADQSVSNTVYYRYQVNQETKEIIENDLPKIREWLKNNYNSSIKTVSFLMHSGHGFEQAVLQPISKEKYQESVKLLKSLQGVETNNELMDNLECSSGHCPIR